MTLHLKSRGYPFRPRLLCSCFIVVGVGFPTVYYFRRGQIEVPSIRTSLPRVAREICGVETRADLHRIEIFFVT